MYYFLIIYNFVNKKYIFMNNYLDIFLFHFVIWYNEHTKIITKIQREYIGLSWKETKTKGGYNV